MSDATKPKTIWTYAEAGEDTPSLVRLTAEHLALATVPAADLEKTVANLEAGGEVVCRTIPLTKITGIVGDVEEGWADQSVGVTVTYRLSDSKTETATFKLAQRSDWNELSGVLLERFGPAWQRKEARKSSWTSALWPLGIAVVVGLVTFWMYTEASLIAEGQHLKEHGAGKAKLVSTVMHLVEGWIGPTGVLVLGAVVLLACLWWLWYNIANPGRQVMLQTMERDAAAAQGN
jgi:hypothetical protein